MGANEPDIISQIYIGVKTIPIYRAVNSDIAVAPTTPPVAKKVKPRARFNGFFLSLIMDMSPERIENPAINIWKALSPRKT
mgnify:CR=1 FL=1